MIARGGGTRLFASEQCAMSLRGVMRVGVAGLRPGLRTTWRYMPWTN